MTGCRIPFKTYLFLAFLTVATMGLSNSSLGYLNYPTQVIFKCCKLIPVLIGGILIQGLYLLLFYLLLCYAMLAWYELCLSVCPSVCLSQINVLQNDCMLGFSDGMIWPGGGKIGYDTILHKTSRYNIVPKWSVVFHSCMLLLTLYTTVRD